MSHPHWDQETRLAEGLAGPVDAGFARHTRRSITLLPAGGPGCRPSSQAAGLKPVTQPQKTTVRDSQGIARLASEWEDGGRWSNSPISPTAQLSLLEQGWPTDTRRRGSDPAPAATRGPHDPACIVSTSGDKTGEIMSPGPQRPVAASSRGPQNRMGHCQRQGVE